MEQREGRGSGSNFVFTQWPFNELPTNGLRSSYFFKCKALGSKKDFIVKGKMRGQSIEYSGQRETSRKISLCKYKAKSVSMIIDWSPNYVDWYSQKNLWSVCSSEETKKTFKKGNFRNIRENFRDKKAGKRWKNVFEETVWALDTINPEHFTPWTF